MRFLIATLAALLMLPATTSSSAIGTRLRDDGARGYSVHLGTGDAAGVYHIGPAFRSADGVFTLGASFVGTLYACNTSTADLDGNGTVDTAAECTSLASLSADSTFTAGTPKLHYVLDIDTANTGSTDSHLVIKGDYKVSSSGSGDGVNENSVVLEMDGNASTTSLTASTDITAAANSGDVDWEIVQGAFTEVFDGASNWTVDATEAIACYTGETTNALLTAIIRMNAAGVSANERLRVAFAIGSDPPGAADIWGHGGDKTITLVDSSPVHLLFADSYQTIPQISSGECIAVLAASDATNTWSMQDAEISIESGDHIYRTSGNNEFLHSGGGGLTGFPVGQVFAGTSDAKRVPTNIFVSPDYSIWFRGSAANIENDAGATAHRINRFLFGRVTSRMNDPLNGVVKDQVEIVSKPGGGALGIWANEVTTGTSADLVSFWPFGDGFLSGGIFGTAGDITGARAPLAVVLEDDTTMQLCAIGYGGTAYGCAAGITAPDYDQYVDRGWVYATTDEAVTVANGGMGGLAIANADGNADATFAAKLSDSTCIYNIGGTSQHANGSLQVGDCDDTINEQGETSISRASNDDNWGITIGWGVSDQSTTATHDTGTEVCASQNLTCVDSGLMGNDGSSTTCATAHSNGSNFWAFCK